MNTRYNGRCYYTRPIQGGGRDSHDYGRTCLGSAPPEPPRFSMAVIITLACALVVGFIAAIV